MSPLGSVLVLAENVQLRAVHTGVSITTVSVGFIFAVSMKNVNSRNATSVMAVISINGDPRFGLCFGILF